MIDSYTAQTDPQQTSIDAFNSVKKQLSQRQETVYKAIQRLRQCTNIEISEYLKIPINQVTPRTNELVKNQYVRSCGVKINEITHKANILWEVIA